MEVRGGALTTHMKVDDNDGPLKQPVIMVILQIGREQTFGNGLVLVKFL